MLHQGSLEVPPHLSEFYLYVNGAPHTPTRTARSSVHTLPSTLNTFTTFSPPNLPLPQIVTATDIQHNVRAYAQVVRSAAAYRQALAAAASAAAEFGAALEVVAKCKGTGSAGEGLMLAGGLHQLVANHQQILAQSIHTSFEVPVADEVARFEQEASENEAHYKTEIRSRSRQLRASEQANLKELRSKRRDLRQYRQSLQGLTSQLDDIERLKQGYYVTTYELLEAVAKRVLTRAGSVVRAEVEIFEGIARKGWSGGGLDELMAGCPDPFGSDGVVETGLPQVGSLEEESAHTLTPSNTDTPGRDESFLLPEIPRAESTEESVEVEAALSPVFNHEWRSESE